MFENGQTTAEFGGQQLHEGRHTLGLSLFRQTLSSSLTVLNFDASLTLILRELP